MAGLMYVAGLRLMKCLRLRVQDVDFAANQITIRDRKGGKESPGPALAHQGGGLSGKPYKTPAKDVGYDNAFGVSCLRRHLGEVSHGR